MNSMANMLSAHEGSNAMNRLLLGTGQARRSVDMEKLSQEYDRLVGEGQEMPPKAAWIKQQLGK